MFTVEEMTLQKILKHHIDGKVQLCPCSSIVSGINNEHKTKALRSFLEHVFKDDDPTFQSHANTHSHCLSCHKAIISGPHPFTELQWQQSKDAETDAVICLLSYFANLCKIRNQGSQRNYPELIEFMEEIDIDISNTEVADQIKSVYERLKEKWAQLKDDITLQEAIPIGLGLINIFDIGPGKAVQDFLPFLNHYCKKTVNVACYDSSRDTKVLMTEFNDNKCCHHYESEKYPLLKQLCGVHKEEMVALTAIDDTVGNTEQETALIDALKKATNVKEVHHLRVSPNTMEEAKRKLEQNVLDASYFDDKPISYSLLLLNIKRTCKSFWMSRTEIKKIAEIYKFKDDGDLDDFLCFFTSFGTIFYTHDIATLREYVIIDIIQFVEHIDDLYNSKEEATIAYGLFVKRPQLDWKVVFEFLTTLGIAVEVKLIQIVQEWSKDLFTTYYFIPTARNVTLSQLDKTTGSLKCSETRELQSIKGYTKDNLQALLCKCLLQCKDRLLVPTDKINTTAIRFRIDDENQDIEFIDDGNRVLVRLLNDSTTTTTTTRQIDKIVDLIVPSCSFFDSCGGELSRQDLIKNIKTVDQKQKGIIVHVHVHVYSNMQRIHCKHLTLSHYKYYNNDYDNYKQ